MRAIQYISAVALCFAVPIAMGATQTLTCSSASNAYQHCALSDADLRDIRIQSVKAGNCTSDNAWGVDDAGIWVNKGCSAVFEYSQVAQSGGSSSTYYEDGPEIVIGAPMFAPYYGPGYYYGAGYYNANGWTENNYYCSGHTCNNNQQHQNPNNNQIINNHPNEVNAHPVEEYHPEENFHSEEIHDVPAFHGGAGGGFHGGGGGRR